MGYFVCVLPMFHLRTGNSWHTLQLKSSVSHCSLVSPTQTTLPISSQPFNFLLFPWYSSPACKRCKFFYAHFYLIKVRIQSWQQHLQAFCLETYTPTEEPPPVSTPPATQSPNTILNYPHTLKAQIYFKEHDKLGTLSLIRTRSKTVIPCARPIHHCSCSVWL